jgi:hypothetical protein
MYILIWLLVGLAAITALRPIPAWNYKYAGRVEIYHQGRLSIYVVSSFSFGYIIVPRSMMNGCDLMNFHYGPFLVRILRY